MTIEREPDTFGKAILRVIDQVGGKEALAGKLGVSESYISRWSNNDDPRLPNVQQSVQIDAFFRERGGIGAPMHEMHELLLDDMASEAAGCRRLLFALLGELVTEHADAVAAILPLTQPGATLQQIRRAYREIGQARGVIGQVMRVVDQLLPTGGQVPGGAQ